MENDKYTQTFRTLGIPIPPLMPNYNPDEYGRMLLAGTRTERGVHYAYSTDYKPPQKTSDTSRDNQPSK